MRGSPTVSKLTAAAFVCHERGHVAHVTGNCRLISKHSAVKSPLIEGRRQQSHEMVIETRFSRRMQPSVRGAEGTGISNSRGRRFTQLHDNVRKSRLFARTDSSSHSIHVLEGLSAATPAAERAAVCTSHPRRDPGAIADLCQRRLLQAACGLKMHDVCALIRRHHRNDDIAYSWRYTRNE
jgi:hypothetical protein